MIFDPNIILKNKNKNFEEEWNNSKKYINVLSSNESYPRFSLNYGRVHPIFETIHNLRNIYLRLGFSETMNPLIVDEKEIKKQFGRESLAVLDRCYYLAGLPKPNIAISDEKINEIKKLFDLKNEDEILRVINNIKKIFHDYKKGKIDGDDLLFELSDKTNIKYELTSKLLDNIFPEFKTLKPVSSTKTLRSHMTSGWFLTLSELLKIKSPPFHLFSIDRCFRREQEEDPSRLFTYFSASCVVLDENITIDYGKAISESILRQFGFEKFMFKLDTKRSKYYTPDTQIEVYAYHPLLKNNNDTKYSNGWIEVATFGIYSPCALSEYGINYPVMNFGLGVERLSMILYNSKDMRSVTYPQFSKYNDWKISDVDLCKEIKLIKYPTTNFGKNISNLIVETAKKYYLMNSPCEYIIWSGTYNNKKVILSILEKEENTKLCGPSLFNEIVVNNGNIYGVINNDKYHYMFENESSRTNITYLSAISDSVASDLEKIISLDISNYEWKFKMIKNISDINLRVSPIGLKYIMSNNKKIDVRGPLFITISVKIVDI